MSDTTAASAAGSKRKEPPSPPTSDDEATDESLNWRLEPDKSHSDWTIIISVDGKLQSTYHVHKAVLSAGGKTSEYFACLFSNTNLKEHESQTSRIDLEDLAAKAFPVMLDYLYQPWRDIAHSDLTLENSVALHYLGRYFEVCGLRKTVRNFWRRKMTMHSWSTTSNVDALGMLYEHAKLFNDGKAYRVVVEHCSACIRFIEIDSHLMKVSDPQFWLDVLQSKTGSHEETSTLISTFCSQHKDELDAETFLNLTDQSLLPMLSVQATMELLVLEMGFVPAASSADVFSTLQERGFLTLSLYRKEDRPAFDEVLSCLNTLPPVVLSKLVALTLKDADETERKLKETETKLKKIVRLLPKVIEVAGAGSKPVNGEYTRTGTDSDGVPCYTMDGFWNGTAAKFGMRLSEEGQAWHISIVEDDGEPRDCLYSVGVPLKNTSALLPPKARWVNCLADYPPPKLKWQNVTEEEDSDEEEELVVEV